MRGFLALALIAALALPAAGAGRRKGGENLLKVVTPPARTSVPAHPFVNAIVRFGTTNNGVGVDPTTFRARLGKKSITGDFEDVIENGVVVGKRAAIDATVGSSRNRLRVDIRSLPFQGKRRLRDADRVRFGAFAAANQPPHARANVASDVIVPDLLTQFDGSSSEDPELDALTFRWDFGDGTPMSEDPRPTHRFASTPGNLAVKLVVDDGQAQDELTLQLFECPPVCEGCTRGRIAVEVPSPLEFAAVAPGATATQRFTVKNVDDAVSSQVHVRLGATTWPTNGGETGAFRVTPEDATLGPGQQVDVDVSFTPTATGHQAAVLPIIACADNQRTCLRGTRTGQLCAQDSDCRAPAGEEAGACGSWRVERLVAHGFGGSAPGTGPTLASEPLFYLSREAVLGEIPLRGILPSGLRFQADNRVRACGAPFTFDMCLADGDCLGGGGCPATGTCNRGDRAGQACTLTSECPGGFCSAQLSLDPSDMCGDGTGTLYILNEDSATDPNTFDSRGSIGRFEFDMTTGARTAAEILYHPSEESTHIACDGLPRGRVYVPEYHELLNPPSGCERDEREALASISKTTGGQVVPPGFGDIDDAAGYPVCEIFDEVQAIRATRDGSAVFVGLPLTGLTRILPKPPVTIVPDYFDTFELHPDGSVVFVVSENRGTTGLLKVYKVSVAQAQQGVLRVSELAPCATVEVPNAGGRTSVAEFAVGRAQADTDDGTILVTFNTTFASAADLPPVFSVCAGGTAPANTPCRIDGDCSGGRCGNATVPRGTVAIASPADSSTCSVIGLHNVELLTLDLLTF